MRPDEKLGVRSIPQPSFDDLINNLLDVLSSGHMSDPSSDSTSSSETILKRALIENANQAWRLSTVVINSESKEIKEQLTPQEIKKMAATIVSLMETLTGLGIKIHDRVGEPFNAGLPEEIVTEEPRDDIKVELIIKTIKPTIMWNQTMVQRGAINIAFPKNNPI